MTLDPIFINNIGKDQSAGKYHLYADDTVVYSVSSTLKQAAVELQAVFEQLPTTLLPLKLVLNTKKNKIYMIVTKTNCKTSKCLSIATLEEGKIEQGSSYKYLGIWIEDECSW